MCRLVPLGARTASAFQEAFVYTVCPQTLGKQILLVSESGMDVPLLTAAAAAHWLPSHAGAGMPSQDGENLEGAHRQ